MKSYTDIEQSKKLAEILPIESADMYYSVVDTIYAKTLTKYDFTHAKVLYGSYDIRSFNVCGNTPCWSLTALLGFIPNYKLSSEHNYHTCTAETSFGEETVGWFDSPVDACYEMILKLKKLKLLFAK